MEAAPVEEQSRVKFNLPCQDCPKSAACLNAKRKELGALLYDREILTKPRSSESSLFPMELFTPMLNKNSQLLSYWHKPFSLEHQYKVVQAWDLAWSERIGGDYLVSMTASIHLPTGKRTLLDLQRWQRVSFDEQIKLISAKWSAFNSDLVIIESDAAQSVWSKHVARNTSVPVKPHAAGGKGDFATGIPSLLLLLENEKWEFPYDPQGPRYEEIQNMLAEFEAFGWVDGKLQGVGEHDDTVMCWYHLNYGLDIFAQAYAGGNGDTTRGNVVPGARA